MAYEIIIKKRFAAKLLKTLNYLEKEWSKEVALAFWQKYIPASTRCSTTPTSDRSQVLRTPGAH